MSTRHCLLHSHERNLLAVIARAASPSLPPHGWRSGRLFMSSLRLIRKGLFAFQKPLPRLSFLDFVQRKERSTFAIQVDSIPNSFRIAVHDAKGSDRWSQDRSSETFLQKRSVPNP